MARRRFKYDPAAHTRYTPEQVVPWLAERFAPRTVLDVGCGPGQWAAVFADLGCEVLGLDGEDVPEELLQIPRERLRVVDLERPVDPPGRYDLALCLEVAEHLTEPAGHRLVELLTSCADVVVFSAAVPGQGGVRHLNEQWPRYWQQIFAAQGFRVEDEIRWRFWDDEEIEWWYRQNMFIALRGGGPSTELHSVVHPAARDWKAREFNDLYRGRVSLRTGTGVFVRTVLNALRGR